MILNPLRLRYVFSLTLLIFTQISLAQEKNALSFSVVAVHFQNIEEDEFINIPNGYDKFGIGPGLEALYSIPILSRVNFSPGINYLFARNSSYINSPNRFRFQELSIPLLFKFQLFDLKRSSIQSSVGTYPGMLTKVTCGYYQSGGLWNDSSNCEYKDGYSNDKHFMDVYFDLGYSFQLNNYHFIEFSPFIKYRVNETWLNYHQEKTQFGIKLSYKLRKTNNENL